MKTQSLFRRMIAFLAFGAILAFSGWAGADPPSRIARLGYITGMVSLSPAGDDDWIHATVNRPITTGDRLWVDDDARAELQTGGAVVRMGAGTSLSVLNLGDRITQLQLTQGTLNVRVRRLGRNQVFEVNTPNLAITMREPGAYRIEVDPGDDSTTIYVRKGQGEVYGEDAAYVIDSRQSYRFTGTDLRDYDYVDAPRSDDFDRWSGRRDRSQDDSRSARYVSQDVVGYQDLDEHGSWRAHKTYGNVWTPNRVAADWAPYRDGHWAWIDPWGWTWVDDAPWGFAVSHYGRWANLGGTWGWVPGPVRSQAYYAPALVVFVGGDNFQLTISSGNVGGVAWFPLAPREVYRPAYQVSRGYFENINVSNTVIKTTVINNYYNNSNVTDVVYANRNVRGAVVAVPTTAFVQSQPVSRSAVQVSRDMIVSAPLAIAARVAPTETSVRGAAPRGGKPPARVFERRVVARTAPPPAPVGFAAQQQQLGASPGKPLDEAARRELKPAASIPAPVVKVVAQKQEAPPTVRPPPAPAGARSREGRKSEAREKGAQREQPAAQQPEPGIPKGAARPTVAPPQAIPAAPTVVPQESGDRSEQRGRAEQRGRDELQQRGRDEQQQRGRDEQRSRSESRGESMQRGQPAAPPQRAAEPEAAPPRASPAPPVVPAAPEALAPEPRGKSVQRDEREPRGERREREKVATPPPAPPARAVAKPEVSPQAAPEVPAVKSREPRDRSEQRGNGGQREREKAVPPVAVPPAAVVPAQRPTEPAVAPPPPAARQPPQPAKPESAERQSGPRPPAAAPRQAPPPPQPAPAAVPPGEERKPAAEREREKKKDRAEEKADEEKREQQKRRDERGN